MNRYECDFVDNKKYCRGKEIFPNAFMRDVSPSPHLARLGLLLCPTEWCGFLAFWCRFATSATASDVQIVSLNQTRPNCWIGESVSMYKYVLSNLHHSPGPLLARLLHCFTEYRFSLRLLFCYCSLGFPCSSPGPFPRPSRRIPLH